MKSKKEIMKDLKFCKELMDRLVNYADDTFHDGCTWGSNRTAIQNDIIRLRRELSEIRRKLDY